MEIKVLEWTKGEQRSLITKEINDFRGNGVTIIDVTKGNVDYEYFVLQKDVSENNNVTNGVFTLVDELPTPAGGMTDLYKLLADNLRYPTQARRMGIEGKVFVEFTVNEDGSLSDF
jgi:periplasmic protein TonB